MSFFSFAPRLRFRRLLRLLRKGVDLLDSGAKQEIAAFVQGQQGANQAFRGPGGEEDLYYTLFGLALFHALDIPPPAIEPWLENLGDGDELDDLVHLCTLGICRGTLCATPPDKAWCERLVSVQIERFRKADGGFSDAPGTDYGTPYGGYLAVLAAHTLGVRFQGLSQVVAAAEHCRARDGGYAEHHGATRGTIPSTLTALALRALRWKRPPREAVDWFEQCRRGDGFAAAPDVLQPDLLCTATLLASNRIQRLGIPIGRRTIAEFVESCWAPAGGFGAAPNTKADTEYTFYALLALGSLA